MKMKSYIRTLAKVMFYRSLAQYYKPYYTSYIDIIEDVLRHFNDFSKGF